MKVRYYTAATLDGFLATPDNSLDWLFAVDHSERIDEIYAAFLNEVAGLVMGSSTYEWLLGHERPHENPGKWEEWYGARPTWVMTHRELPVIPGADVALHPGRGV